MEFNNQPTQKQRRQLFSGKKLGANSQDTDTTSNLRSPSLVKPSGSAGNNSGSTSLPPPDKSIPNAAVVPEDLSPNRRRLLSKQQTSNAEQAALSKH